MDLCPRGDSAGSQPGCVCRAQLRAGLTHEGRFPLQQWQPWDEAQSQLAQREHTRARPWAQSSSAPNLGSQPVGEVLGGSTPGGSMYTSNSSPVLCPAFRGGECVSQGKYCFHGSTSSTTRKCLAQLTWGTRRRQLRQLFPTLRAIVHIKWPTKYFLFYRNYYKKLINLEHL